MSENRVIGAGSRIPWHLPEDFRWFKQMTTGHVLVMGRKTFQSIGRPLPNRTTVILSRQGAHCQGTLSARSWEDLEQLRASFGDRQVFIAGGAEIYKQALPLCSDLYLTHVKRVVEGDVFFPAFEHLFEPVEQVRDTPEFCIVHYRRKS